MRAAVLTEPGRIELRETPVPEPDADETLVEVETVGLCGTDLKLWRGELQPRALPLIPGHEVAGVLVEDCSAGRAGQRVACYIYEGCGHCARCLGGSVIHCPQRVRLGLERAGGMAEYVAVKEANLLPFDEGTQFASAAVAMDAVATPLAALAGASLGHETDLLICGAGGLGLNAVQIAVAQGCRVVVIEPSPRRRELAMELGAERAFAPPSGGEGVEGLGQVDVALECSGVAASFDTAIRALRPGGQVICCGYRADGAYVLRSEDLVLRGLQVTGSLAAGRDVARRALEAVGEGTVRPLISHRLDLEHVADAYRLLAEGAALGRIVLDVGEAAGR